jgi:dTDP-4-dehydrorhamnose reductase
MGVFNCAAYTNVDGAETDEQTARAVNGLSVGVLADQCKNAGVPLVHFSTDYVFDGQAKAPYATDHPRAPLGAYGRTKALGEELLENSGVSFLLVRTSWVYAPMGKNFVLTIARLCKEKEQLKVVSDQRGRPTHAKTLAERSLALFQGGHRGPFHVTDEGECSWFEFACAIRSAAEASCELEPCTTAEFPRPAPRPPYSVLDTSKADRILGPAPHYTSRLAEMHDLLKSL